MCDAVGMSDGDHETEVPEGSAVPTLVLIGARSRAARAIAREWTGPIVAVHRDTASGPEPDLRVADYGKVPPDAIPPGSVVVNCVGTPVGTADALRHLNHDVAWRWALAARDAGARRFIQLSSFSVYGLVEHIDAETPLRPQGEYGRTKLAAEQSLLPLSDGTFGVTIVRLPMLFGDGTDKLTRLIGLIARIGALPRTHPPIARSMLGYHALAIAIRRLARDQVDGVVHVADPVAFSYELLGERWRRTTARNPRRLPVPGVVARLLRRFVPHLHARLLASSLLAPDMAYRFAMPPQAGLTAELDRIIAGRG